MTYETQQWIKRALKAHGVQIDHITQSAVFAISEFCDVKSVKEGYTEIEQLTGRKQTLVFLGY